MKVAYITMQFPVPSETFACNDVRTLKKMGVEVSVHGLRPPHPDAEIMLRERGLEGTCVTHTTIATLGRGFTYGLRHFSKVFDLLAWLIRVTLKQPVEFVKSLILIPRVLEIYETLQTKKPGVVHIYWGHYPSLVAYLVERYLPEIAISVSLSAYDLHTEFGGTSFVAQRADMVKTLAQANINHIEKSFGVPAEKIEVIYDSVDMTKLDAQLIASKKLSPGKKRIVSVGRLIDGKGMSDVLDVFSQVYKAFPNTCLTILGDGPLREALEAKARALGIEKATVFGGHVNHDEVFKELAVADIFLFMSKSERLPNVVKEAMLSRCVCVVSNTVGIEELIPSRSYGYIVPCGDITQATASVLNILNAPEQHLEMLVKAERHIRENFDVAISAAKYIKLWKKILRGKGEAFDERVVA